MTSRDRSSTTLAAAGLGSLSPEHAIRYPFPALIGATLLRFAAPSTPRNHGSGESDPRPVAHHALKLLPESSEVTPHEEDGVLRPGHR